MAAENIFQQYLQPVRSVQDYSNDMDRQEQNALTLAASRQSMADDTAKRSAYQQSGGDQNKLMQLLRAGGQHKAVQELQASMLADEKVRSGILRDKAQTGSAEAESAQKTYALRMQKHEKAIKDIAGFQTPDQAAASLQAHMAAGDVDPTKGQAMLASIPKDPAQFATWQLGMLRNMMAAKDQIELVTPKPLEQSNGQQKFFVDNNPNSPTFGKQIGAAPVQMQATPGEVLSNSTSIENNKRSVGASLTNAAATREVAAATKQAGNAQRDQATEMKLADDYRAQSKEFGQSKAAHQQLSATLASATTSPAATLAAATKFMKILDPGSVVRESELGMALSASGVIDRAMNYVSTLSSGKKLTADQARDFKDISDKMFVAAQQVQQTIDADYKGKAKAYGLRPEMVVQDLGQNAGKVVNFSDLK